jgi:RNA polymerase sigma-B factor
VGPKTYDGGYTRSIEGATTAPRSLLAARIPECAHRELWIAYVTYPTIDNRNRLVVANHKLVYAATKGLRRYSRPDFDFDDIVAAGFHALVKAIPRYEPARGKPSTFLFQEIRWAARRASEESSHIPIYKLRMLVDYSSSRDELAVRLKREPTRTEICDAIGTDQRTIEQLMIASNPESLDSPQPGEVEGDSMADRLGATEHDYEPIELISGLGAREQRIVQLVLLDGVLHEQVAKQMGLSKTRVSQILQRATEKMRLAITVGDAA